MRIVVATDGSIHSEIAARTLVALRPPADAEITVLHVIQPPHYWVTPTIPPSYHAEWHKVQHEMLLEAEEAAESAIEHSSAILGSAYPSVKSVIRHGHPAEEIVLTTKETDADLVVVGSQGLTGSKLFLLGSVSQKVVKYAPCSVLLTKPGSESDPPNLRRVLLATDGSDNANRAASFLSGFQLQSDSEVILLHVVQQYPRWFDRHRTDEHLRELTRLRHEHAKHVISNTNDNLRTNAVITTAIREGEPAEEILQFGSEISADMIVLGSKGLSGIKLFLLGSVSQRVCRYSDASVMLVKLRQTSDSPREELIRES